MTDLLASLERLVRAIVGDTKYFKQYPCTVQAQTGDGPVDVLPDDAEIAGPGGLQGVPIWNGLPGITVEVEPGARVLLGFIAGDPRRPYVSLWEKASIKAIRFDGGDKPIAREGDPVVAFFPPVPPGGIQGVILGGPFAGQAFTNTTPIPAGLGVGIITSGNDQVRA